ncbi:hypothetical protein ACJ41O_010941 [Fusarium nematophilum]
MRLLTGKVAVIALALCNSCTALKATILADTNRDGKVDTKGTSDVAGKATWTNSRGALFLANIGDTNGRCAKKWGPSSNFPADGTDAKEAYLNQCNDATGNVQRNPKYLAPVRTLPIAKLSASAKGTVHVSDKTAAGKVRVFVKKAGKWNYVDAKTIFKAADLKAGLELGIDARDVRRPKGWNGKATIHFTVTDGKAKATDSVAFRVAPVLTHHHVQRAERVFSTADQFNGSQALFVTDLEKNVAAAGIKKPVFLFDNQDKWTQDFFEPGYTSIPGPSGPKVLRVMIRSVQAGRPSGRDIFHQLRSSSVGAVQQPGWGTTIDSTGNLETIPPHKHNGKSFPAGRVIMGQWDGVKPLMFDFLKAQGVQDPLALDTAWLAVGHVDEFLQFLPANNARGWILMADDPVAGFKLLKKAAADGHGKKKAVSRPRLAGEDPALCLPKETIDDVLKLESFEAINKMCAERIEANLAIIKRETGITDKDIYRVPATFYDARVDHWTCAAGAAKLQDEETPADSADAPGALSAAAPISGGPGSKAQNIIEAADPLGLSNAKRQAVPLMQVVAFYPGTINGLVVGEKQVIAPNPWGPVIGGKDIIKQAVTSVYTKAGYKVKYQDDWFSHHLLMGEVHCGSNSWRQTGPKWW